MSVFGHHTLFLLLAVVVVGTESSIKSDSPLPHKVNRVLPAKQTQNTPAMTSYSTKFQPHNRASVNSAKQRPIQHLPRPPPKAHPVLKYNGSKAQAKGKIAADTSKKGIVMPLPHPRPHSVPKRPSLYPHKVVAGSPRPQTSHPTFTPKIGGMYLTENGHISYWPSLYSVLFPPKYPAETGPRRTPHKATPTLNRGLLPKIPKPSLKANVLRKQTSVSSKRVPEIPKSRFRQAPKPSSGTVNQRDPVRQNSRSSLPLRSRVDVHHKPIPKAQLSRPKPIQKQVFKTTSPKPAANLLHIVELENSITTSSTTASTASTNTPSPTSSFTQRPAESHRRRHPTAVRSPPFLGVRPSRVQIREPLSEADFNDQIFSIFRSLNISMFVVKTQDGSLRASADPQKTWFIPLRHGTERAEPKDRIQLHNIETDDLQVIVSGAKRDSSEYQHLPHITYTELEQIAPGMSRYYAKVTND